MARADEKIGQVLDGKYRIDSLIGMGGMGAVYAGTHLKLDRRVAVKILKADFLGDPIARSRFEREARTTARIDHINAVAVYDFGSLDGGDAFLVMEYVDGASLRQILRDRGTLTLTEAADIARQAAGALSAAHARGVVHRDVKPENIIVTSNADGAPHVKVLDFGIAKLLSGDSATQLTNPCEVVGTPRYMAPEQFSERRVDERVDVYALGVVLYEMLAGRAPFEGSFSEVVGKHIYAEPPSFASLGVDVPEAVEQIILQALAKDPEDRFVSAAEFGAAVSAAVGLEWASGSFVRSTHGLVDNPSTVRSPSLSNAPTVARLVGDSAAFEAFASEPALATSYGTDVTRDAVTEVRSDEALPTVLVPAAFAEPRADVQAPARAMAAAASARGVRVAGPIVLAAATIFGLGAMTFGTHDGPNTTSVPAAASAAPVVQTAPAPVAEVAQQQASDDAPATGSRAKQQSGANVAERRGGQSRRESRLNSQSSRASAARTAPAGGRAPRTNPLKTVGKALRIDRQIGRLFR